MTFKTILLGAAALSAVALPSTVNAAIIYELNIGTTIFTFEVPTFIEFNQTISDPNFSCNTDTVTCNLTAFRDASSINGGGIDKTDAFGVNYITSSGFSSGYYYFEDNSFSKFGEFKTPDQIFNVATLKITQAVQAVPEPATWAMFLLGFGAIGYSMRRRNRTVTKVSFA